MKEGEFGKIRETIKGNRGSVANAGKDPDKIDGENNWLIYDSSIYSFARTFDSCLPPKYGKDERRDGFRIFIEERLDPKMHRPGNLTAIEFGGPGSKLFADFTPKFFRKTVGVCLKDIREEKQKVIDDQNNHLVITGDVVETGNMDTINKVIETLGVKKTDLIISRMEGGLDMFIKHPAILDRIFRNWYELLNDNGIAFIQFAREQAGSEIKDMVEKWANAVQKKYPKVEIQVYGGVLRINKCPGSPKKLPPVKELFPEEAK